MNEVISYRFRNTCDEFHRRKKINLTTNKNGCLFSMYTCTNLGNV